MCSSDLERRPHVVETLNDRAADNVLDKRQTAPFAVDGVSGSGVQPRLEIRQLMQNANQFNIFILALQAMQQDNQSDFLSYFSIAGNALCTPKIQPYSDFTNRHTRSAGANLGRRGRRPQQPEFRLLPTHVQYLLDMAQAVPGSLRGERLERRFWNAGGLTGF